MIGARLIGAGWMIVSLMFIVLAATVALRPTGWPQAPPVALALSTLLCGLGWPKAKLGLVMNGLLAMAWLPRFG